MTNRERIWIKACRWVAGWQGGKSTPTPQMAYLSGWQAAMREVRKSRFEVWRDKTAADVANELVNR